MIGEAPTRRPWPLQRDEARQDLGRHLHAREHRLVGHGIAHEHAEAERQVRDVRERPPGGDRQRRQRREDHLLEVPGQLRALLVVELVHGDRRGCRARPARGAGALRSSAVSRPPSSSTRSRISAIVSDGDAPVVAGLLDAGVDLVVQTGDAHHEELVEVRRVDRAELHALEQRHPLVLGQLQHALVEVQPGQLAVQVERGVVQVGPCFARGERARGSLVAHCLNATSLCTGDRIRDREGIVRGTHGSSTLVATSRRR